MFLHILDSDRVVVAVKLYFIAPHVVGVLVACLRAACAGRAHAHVRVRARVCVLRVCTHVRVRVCVCVRVLHVRVHAQSRVVCVSGPWQKT